MFEGFSQHREAGTEPGELAGREGSEMVRERLTAEFLLVKLQAQEVLAQAERAANSATVEFNIALAELAQATGTVLDLHVIDSSLSHIMGAEVKSDLGDPDTSG